MTDAEIIRHLGSYLFSPENPEYRYAARPDCEVSCIFPWPSSDSSGQASSVLITEVVSTLSESACGQGSVQRTSTAVLQRPSTLVACRLVGQANHLWHDKERHRSLQTSPRLACWWQGSSSRDMHSLCWHPSRGI